jgi:hypothetical protein
MSSSREFTELLNLLATDDKRLSITGDLSPYLSRLSKTDASNPSNSHHRGKSDATSPPADPEFSFTFKQMIHTLYDTETWAEKVKDLIEESKSQFKPLPEELKSPGLSSRTSSGEEGSQIRTIKKRCTGRTHIPDPVFIPKPTYVSHNARTSTVDLHIEGRKSDAAPSPTKRRPSQSRTIRPTLALTTGTRRPRYRSLTLFDVRSPLQGGPITPSDSDSGFDEPIDVKPIPKLPPLKIPKRSSTTSTVPIQPSIVKGHRQNGRARSSSLGGSTCLLTSPVFRTFEPDGKRHALFSDNPYQS